MTEFSRAHRAFGRRDREGDSDSAMNPSMGARTVHSGQLLKPGGSFWVFRMSNEFAGQYRQSEHQCQIPLRSDRNSSAMAGLLTNKISDSIFALGTIVAVATLLLGCCISQIRSGLGRSPHAVSSGGGSIQFNLDCRRLRSAPSPY